MVLAVYSLYTILYFILSKNNSNCSSVPGILAASTSSTCSFYYKSYCIFIIISSSLPLYIFLSHNSCRCITYVSFKHFSMTTNQFLWPTVHF